MPLASIIILAASALILAYAMFWPKSDSLTLSPEAVDAQLYALDPELAIELGYEPPKARAPRPGEVIPMRVGEKWVDLGALAHQNAIIIRGNRYDAA